MSYLIGIDAGTSRVKAVLFDIEGHEEKVVYRDNEPLYTGPNQVEQDMEVLWNKIVECLTEVVKGYDKGKILGVSISGQGEGCWLIDKHGKPVSHSILWCDGRAKNLVNELIKDQETYKFIYETTGTQPLTGTALVLLLWSKKHRKDILDQADKLLFTKDWIRYKLTGQLGLDTTDTATSLMDIKTLKVSDELFAKLGLSEYKYLLSDINKPSAIAGTLTEEIAAITGLNKETPVAFGALDVVATTIGAGAINNGDVCTVLGTTCATMIVTNQCTPGTENTRFEKHGIDDLYINLQPTMSGTTNIDWVVDSISTTTSFKEIDEMIKELKPVPTGVIYHPYVSTSGERSPFFSSNARASFFGINSLTTRYDLIKAVYEGIAFSIRDCLDTTTSNSGTISLAGGGAKSETWARIIADVTNRQVIVSDGNEFAAKGAIMMLGVSLGLYQDYEDAVRKTCRPKAIYQPNPENVEHYNKFFEFYKEARLTFNSLWDKRYNYLQQLGEGKY
jgi:xylulokinase